MDGHKFAAPYIWVSHKKHANAPTDQLCDEGGPYVLWIRRDDCLEDHITNVRYLLTKGYFGNVGAESSRFIDCRNEPLRYTSLPVVTWMQCFWNEGIGPFRGWLDDDPDYPDPSPQVYGWQLDGRHGVVFQ